MKYIITENQQEKMMKHISELLNDKFKDSSVICEIKVFSPDEEEYDYEVEKGLKYDITVFINEKFTRTGGIYGFKIATEKKIKKILHNWLGIEDNEYYIWTLVKDC
jgi:hypothetical protein